MTGLQWTNPRDGATLHCNVDRLDGGGLTVEILPSFTFQTSPIKRAIPWIFICAANAS
jgi:hypothetical protein